MRVAFGQWSGDDRPVHRVGRHLIQEPVLRAAAHNVQVLHVAFGDMAVLVQEDKLDNFS